MKRFVVMDSTYKTNDNGAKVVLFGRNYDNKYETAIHEIPFLPYFYIPVEEKHLAKSPYIKHVHDTIIEDALGRSVLKVDCFLPSDVPKVRDLFSWTDESDILFDKRYLIDSKIKYSYVVDNDTIRATDVPEIIEPRIVYCDIEVLSPEGVFPSPLTAQFPIITIQVLDNYTDKIAVFTCRIPPTSDPCHIQLKDEAELIKMFGEYLKEVDPDIIALWNGDQFDIPYIINRCNNLGISLKGLSRFGQSKTEFNPETGKFRNKTTGRACLDMMEAFKKYNVGGSQRESNGLKSVISDKDLLDDMAFSYDDLGPILQKIIDEKRYTELIDYCKNDVIALKTIDNKLGLYKFFETIRFIAGNKIMDSLYNSLIIEMLLMHDGIAPMPRKVHREKTKEDEFDGALVIEPEIGIHDWVGTVDLNALYPNILVGFNVSADIHGQTVKSVKKLMEMREKYRALKTQGVHGAEILDATAKSLVNSVYGVIGSPAFRLFDKNKALFITSTGQDINRYIQELCKKQSKKIVYGDSVSNDTVIKVYNSNGEWEFINIEDLFTELDIVGFDGKEYCILDDVYVESINDDGKVILDKIKCVMRHKTTKQMYRVHLTNQIYIDVTEDHSLCVYINKKNVPKIKQVDRIGLCPTSDIESEKKSIIMKRRTIHNMIDSKCYDKKMYEYLGYHLGDGTLKIHSRKKENGEISSWVTSVGISFCSHKKELFEYFSSYILENGFADSIVEDYRQNKCYNLTKSSKFGQFLFKTLGHSNEKFVPKFMFNESLENISAFIRGYFSADGTIMIRDGMPILRITSVNKHIITDIQELLYKLGIASSYSKENNTNSFNGKDSGTYSYLLIVGDHVRFMKNVGFLQSFQNEKYYSCKINPYKIEDNLDWTFSNGSKIEKIDYNGYVYDLTTVETHKFFANNILAKNTDSVFISPITSKDECLNLENYLNDELAKWSKDKGSVIDFKLKAEKIFKRLMFKPKASDRKKSGKKKYAGHLVWKEGKDKNELSYMGLELKRSDNSIVTKNCLKYFLETVLIDGDIYKAAYFVKKQYKLIKSGNISIYDISIPKEIRKLNYNSKNSWIDGIDTAKRIYKHQIEEGTKPRLVYLKHGVICIDDNFPVEKIADLIDYDKMADKVIKSKMESYLWAVGLEWNTIVKGQKLITDFF